MSKNALASPLPDTDRNALIARCEAWIAQAQWPRAIALASAQVRQCPDAELESLILQWRQLGRPPGTAPSTTADWPPAHGRPLAAGPALPDISATDLDSDMLRRALRQHGALLVRGLLGPEQVSQRVEGIDLAFEALAGDPEGTSPWYRRNQAPTARLASEARPWVERLGGILLADSPRNAAQYIDLLEQTSVIEIIAGYLGERPMLSAGKTTLRKVPPSQAEAGWHQDGAFLGAGIRSVNLWLSLSHCGDTASGLDLIPRRLHGKVETGTRDAAYTWSVAAAVVEDMARETPVASPVFAPGDALLFDEWLLHRTGTPPGMRHVRYAIESWFFAPSGYPVEQGPILL